MLGKTMASSLAANARHPHQPQETCKWRGTHHYASSPPPQMFSYMNRPHNIQNCEFLHGLFEHAEQTEQSKEGLYRNDQPRDATS